MVRINNSHNVQDNYFIQSDNIESQKQIKNSIFEDKNGNGVTDEGDFTNEQWEKLKEFGNIFKKAQWTKSLSNLFYRIFNQIEYTENTSEEISITNQYGKRAIIFDDKTRTLKIANINEGNEYDGSYYEFKLDSEANIEKTSEVSINGHYIAEDGKDKKISYQMFHDFVTSMGFKQLQEQKYTQEEIEQRIELWKKSGAYYEEDYTENSQN